MTVRARGDEAQWRTARGKSDSWRGRRREESRLVGSRGGPPVLNKWADVFGTVESRAREPLLPERASE